MLQPLDPTIQPAAIQPAAIQPAARRCLVVHLAISVCLASVSVVCIAESGRAQAPTLTDKRLDLSLFAETPDIVTPIGMVIDPRDRVFVIESHTHHPPADYDGPNSDRIKIFVDRDNDGKPDQISIFAEGIEQAMNLAFSPTGDLYVVCAREVIRLVDDDDDGRCDRRQQIVKLVTAERYAHNSLLGITFRRDGWLYISRGNTGSHGYRFQGTDDSTVEGFGDGGSVIRCRPDGTDIEEVATGFWNPFDLKFDRAGRLLLVDNDPDARGPNRLVHVIESGDYGYKSLYGGAGNHPFQGWDGTLPGTLPSIAGTGEAPSGLIDCQRSSLPSDYADSVLVTVWNENSIERFDLQTWKGTLKCNDKSIFLKGSKDFRPVAIDCDSRGNLFITDWVLVNYPNHGRGRIWRISSRANESIQPQSYFDPYQGDSTSDYRDAAAHVRGANDLAKSLTDDDAFTRHEVVRRVARRKDARKFLDRLASHNDASVRLGSLLAIRRSGTAAVEAVPKFLTDPDPEVRRAALMWAGESMETQLRPRLDAALSVTPVTANLFATYVAATQNLDERFVKAFHAGRNGRSKDVPRSSPSNALIRIAHRDDLPEAVRGMAVAALDDDSVAKQSPWLLSQLDRQHPNLSRSIIRRLGESDVTDPAFTDAVSAIALDPDRMTELRCDALLALASHPIDNAKRFLPLLESDSENVAIEAARTFRAWLDSGGAEDCVEAIASSKLPDAARSVLSYVNRDPFRRHFRAEARPQSKTQWLSLLGDGGNAARGRRVFYSGRVGCSKCHTVDGRGAVLGPDLSGVAQSKSRLQIAEAIIDPSADFPPQYQAWMVLTVDGRTYRGLQLDHKSGGAIELITETGDKKRFEADDIEDYVAAPVSLMPSGLPETMAVSELKDLVAFLASLR